MTNSPESTFAKRAGLIITILNALILLIAFGIVIWNGFSVFQEMFFDPGILNTEIVGFISAIFYTVIALLIVNQQPHHTVGWLFFIIGFGSALGSLAVSATVLSSEILTQPTFVLLLWTNSWTWILTFFILPSLVVLYFPDGRLPSRHWWPVLIVTLIGLGGYIVHDAFSPPSEISIGILANEKFFDQLLDISEFMLTLGIIGSLVAMFVRFRRSHGIVRVQMKWLVYVFGLGISTALIFVLVAGEDNSISSALFISLPLLMAITMGTAILRHGLFDIDIIIRRTLVYGVLTLLLVGVYFGSVVLLTQAFRALTGQESPVAIVISTLIIAALFNPLRLRVQEAIDRRFYRRKYDAQKALAEFAATARDEVDMNTLTYTLLEVVEETMQPEQVSLWLRAGERE